MRIAEALPRSCRHKRGGSLYRSRRARRRDPVTTRRDDRRKIKEQIYRLHVDDVRGGQGPSAPARSLSRRRDLLWDTASLLLRTSKSLVARAFKELDEAVDAPRGSKRLRSHGVAVRPRAAEPIDAPDRRSPTPMPSACLSARKQPHPSLLRLGPSVRVFDGVPTKCMQFYN